MTNKLTSQKLLKMLISLSVDDIKEFIPKKDIKEFPGGRIIFVDNAGSLSLEYDLFINHNSKKSWCIKVKIIIKTKLFEEYLKKIELPCDELIPSLESLFFSKSKKLKFTSFVSTLIYQEKVSEPVAV